MKKLAILGATGSIGSSTLKVIESNLDHYEVVALAAGQDAQALFQLCVKWKPKYAVLYNEEAAQTLRTRLTGSDVSTEVLSGQDGLCTIASLPEVDMVMAAIVGAAGLPSTLAAAKAGKTILLANKESLVMSGQLLIDAVAKYGSQLLPVDSEHNAIFQCLPETLQQQLATGSLTANGVSKILLTGSGGPFRYSDLSQLAGVTPQQAIAHPNWSMGPKISVDSATMMNKGLEYIEAKWLFNASRDQLDVIIHPQSVIHSMVQYKDGSVLAQMGEPDMRTPIAHTMAYPKRISSGVKPLNFMEVGELTFLKPDFDRYPCLGLAIEACYEGQHATTALNAANEIAVEAFLHHQLGFMDIARVNQAVMNKVCSVDNAKQLDCLDNLIQLDTMARNYAAEFIKGLKL